MVSFDHQNRNLGRPNHFLCITAYEHLLETAGPMRSDDHGVNVLFLNDKVNIFKDLVMADHLVDDDIL